MKNPVSVSAVAQYLKKEITPKIYFHLSEEEVNVNVKSSVWKYLQGETVY